jgi:hypothetical protein
VRSGDIKVLSLSLNHPDHRHRDAGLASQNDLKDCRAAGAKPAVAVTLVSVENRTGLLLILADAAARTAHASAASSGVHKIIK